MFKWKHVAHVAGLAVLGVELREVILGNPVDQGLLLIAAGLLGLPAVFKK